MRKTGSIIRDRIQKILSVAEKTYGYEIFKIYERVYGDVLLRSIYYNLNKGVEEDIFVPKEMAAVPGDFTWGFESSRIYYSNKKPIDLDNKEYELILKAVKEIKKEIQKEFKKWIAETSKEMKQKNMTKIQKMKLLKKCVKIKNFYQDNFGKYPKELDQWINTLTP